MLINGVERDIKPYATLSEANLSGADLFGADLSEANLSEANLSRANLSRAKYIPLNGQTYLPGVRYTAYKATTNKRVSIMVHSSPGDVLDYSLDGREVSVNNANTDRRVLCAAGINVATADYIMREHREKTILLVEFDGADVAAVPYASDGKFRLHRCKVIREVTKEFLCFFEAQSSGPTVQAK